MKLSEIDNLKLNVTDTRFASKNRKALCRFLNYLLIEYAIGYQHLDDMDQEIYSAVRMAYTNGNFRDLRNDMKKIEENARFLQLLPKSGKRNFDEDEWKSFEEKFNWEVRKDGNIFSIGEIKINTDQKFLNLVQYEGEYYAQYLPSGQEYFIRFEYMRKEEDPSAVKSDNVYQFLNAKDSAKEEAALRITEEEFFYMKSVSEADPEQRKAVKHGTEGNLVVLAGAGSGKTRTLVWRLAYLHLVRGIPVHKILLVTFARDATEKMREQSNQIIKKIYEEKGRTLSGSIEARTIDGFIYKIIMDYCPWLGFSATPEYRTDPEQRVALLNKVITENHMEDFFSYYFKNERLSLLLRNLERYASGLPVNITGIDVLLRLYIEAQKNSNIIVDFLYASHIVKESINEPGSLLKSNIEKQYQCVLFDEFQDISSLQNEIFKPFYNSGIHFTFVGDDDQSIYGWRGSDNEIIRNIIKEKDTATIYLMTNYRNNPNIVNAGNAILRMIRDRAKTDKEITANRKSGARLRVMDYDNTYTNLANEVERLIQDGKRSEEICILCRAGGEVKAVTDALKNCKVPVAGSKTTFKISAYFQLLEAMLYIHNGVDLIGNCDKIRKYAKLGKNEKYSDIEIQDILLGEKSAKGDNMRCLQTISESMLYKSSLLSEMVYRFSLKANEVFFEIADERLSDPSLEEFERYCYNNKIGWPIGAADLQRIFRSFKKSANISSKGFGIGSGKGVTISTIHRAKGLEYDTVIIVGLNYGEYPNIGKIQNSYNNSLNELNRLKNSAQNYHELKAKMNLDIYNLMTKECVSNGFSDEISEHMDNLCEELEDGRYDHIQLTGDGIEDFIFSFRKNILFIDKEHARRLGLLDVKSETLRNKENALFQEISIIKKRLSEKAEENDGGFSEDTESEDTVEVLNDLLESKTAERGEIVQEINSIREEVRRLQFIDQRFKISTPTLREHYSRCLQAQGFLEEMKKAERIEILKEQLKKEMEKKENEERRLFYVAVTRAINLLYLCYNKDKKPSEFITSIPERYRGNYIGLTREQRTNIEKTRNFLRKKLSVPVVNSQEIDEGIHGLIKEVADSNNYKELIDERVKQFKLSNPLCAALKGEALEYVNRGFSLLAIAELTDMEYITEFAHNMQRAAEVILQHDAGANAQPFKTDDSQFAKKIAKRVRQSVRNCKTHPPSEQFIIELITKDPAMGSLKKAGIMHFIVRSKQFNLRTCADATWNKKKIKGNAEEFLCAVIDLANIRNSLIHPGHELWNKDTIDQIFRNFNTILKSRP